MGESFQEYYKDKITEYLRDNLNTISLDTFNLNKAYFRYQDILNNTKVIQEAVDTFVNQKNIERLQLLNEILSRGKFKPEKYFFDVIKKPLKELYSEQDDEEKKTVIKSLAEKFSITLSEDSEKEDKSEEE